MEITNISLSKLCSNYVLTAPHSINEIFNPNKGYNHMHSISRYKFWGYYIYIKGSARCSF